MSLVGCVGDVGEGKEKAEVSDEVVEEVAKAPSEDGLAVDVAQSKIGALGAKVSATMDLGFTAFSGTVGMEGEDVSWIRYEVQTGSVTSPYDRLTEHLKNSDFFDVPNHPTSTFQSTAIRAKADGAWTHEVEGDLQLRGQTKHITFPATIDVAADKVSANTEFTIDRTWFGITYEGKKDDLIQDNVVLTIQLVAPRS